MREDIEALRNADERKLAELAQRITEKRIKWFANNQKAKKGSGNSPLITAYRVFLEKLGITEDDAPIVHRDNNRIVIHSKNFCPTLKACTILGLDTRFVCRHLTEKPTTDLMRQIHPNLRFKRNYDKIRPYSAYCEEMIVIE